MRYTGPKTRINRRLKMAVFNPKKAFERKPHLPGIHGPRLRRRETEYSKGLIEKQKIRFKYGLTEKQMRKYMAEAKRIEGITGENFIRGLETRLDNVVYLMGLARSRPAARQFVNHGHVKVNGQKVDIPSYQCRVGDQIEIRPKTSSRHQANMNLENAHSRAIPAWIDMNSEAMSATLMRFPIPTELEQEINMQIVVEFYSR